MTKYELGKWNLSELVKDPKNHAFEKKIKLVQKRSEQFEKIKSKLNSKISTKEFKKIFSELEEISEKISTIGGYASLLYSADTQSDEDTSSVKVMESPN